MGEEAERLNIAWLNLLTYGKRKKKRQVIYATLISSGLLQGQCYL